ncbi:hypothetical protein M422DRAFT_47836 [Sphaerobolus stellatus SS14]|uniref:Unplaced genomic scaffold SPHSTscaffold_47, whole genome shotgun sequence n=1 Tax=Sphaerobolus stellatus (strain SS14) TaxID=990650 RepID=A0A0C9UKH6_SPHS4|nr:hypothetical protein M422DRAFT_47836 [Sphaerobolus stellatus SS14]
MDQSNNGFMRSRPAPNVSNKTPRKPRKSNSSTSFHDIKPSKLLLSLEDCTPMDPFLFQESTAPSGPSSGLQTSIEKLNAASFDVPDRIERESYGDTTTTRDFPRYVENYRVWWVEREGRLQQQDPSYTPIPPFPITVAKVVFFLDYEKSRPKRKCGGGEILGTQVGSSLVSQTINALEAKRKRECHKHPKNHDTQKSLRDDLRTKVIEGAMKHKKP